MIKAIVVILAIFASANANFSFLENEGHSLEKLFSKFLHQHNKSYNAVELSERFLIFAENIKNHGLHLLLEENPKFSPFFDVSEQEFSKTHLNLRTDLLERSDELMTVQINGDVPSEFDWRDHGAVTPVKDQGQCGSCWAFSTTGNIEGVSAIKTGVIQQLSESQLVDCDNVNQGCNGGIMHKAMDYLKANGSQTETSYPYKPVKRTCKYDAKEVVVNISGYSFIANLTEARDEKEIRDILYSNGPLSIAINATPFQFYTGGVFNPSNCKSTGLNHGVLIVGYGSENGNDFWIIKNSWGNKWGEKGYIRILRGKGVCGLNTYVVTARIN
jgi:cathepsin F